MQKDMNEILQQWLQRYSKKSADITDSAWLTEQLQLDLHISQEDALAFSHNIHESTQAIISAKSSLEKNQSRGMNSEEWFYREIQRTSLGLNTQHFGEYLSGIDVTIAECNKQWEKVFFTKDGCINQNPNLSGFIFEQEQVNSFNMDASLKGENIRAEVLRPAPGQVYAKNSPDIRVSDGTKYQAKTSYSQERTHTLLEAGDYSDQQGLVPKGQSVAGKSVETIEGGAASSRPVSYEEIKTKQRQAQQEKITPETSWNDYTNKDLALNIGAQAATSALYGALVGGLCSAGKTFCEDGKFQGEEVAVNVIQEGAKAGAISAVAGAIKVGIEKNVIPWPKSPPPFLPTFPTGVPAIPYLPLQAHVIGAIATTVVEHAATAYKVAKGEMTAKEGFEAMESTALATVCGLSAASKGSAVGAALGIFLGPYGVFAGGIVGGALGYMAGSAVGQLIAKGQQALREKACELVSATKKVVSNVWHSFKSTISSFLSW